MVERVCPLVQPSRTVWRVLGRPQRTKAGGLVRSVSTAGGEAAGRRLAVVDGVVAHRRCPDEDVEAEQTSSRHSDGHELLESLACIGWIDDGPRNGLGSGLVQTLVQQTATQGRVGRLLGER